MKKWVHGICAVILQIRNLRCRQGLEAPTQLVHDRSKTRLQNPNHEIGWDFLCTPLSPLTDFLT